MKLGIIGSGFIADEFMENIKEIEGISVVGCCSRTKANAEAFKEKFNIDKVYDNAEELMNSEIDSIYIASHSNSHYEYSLKAIEAGLNILCEKPVTINAKELEEVLAKANEKGIVFMEGMRLIYMPAYLKVKKLIEEKHFGKVISIETSGGRISSRLYRHTLELAGGSLLDLGVYCIYALIDLLGTPNKINVSALKLDTKVDSTVMGVFEYPEALGSLYCSCVSQTRGDLRVLCQTGVITLPQMSIGDTVILTDKNGESETLKLEKKSTGMYYEIIEFMKRVENNKDKVNSLTDKENLSLEVMKTMDYIRKEIDLKYPGE